MSDPLRTPPKLRDATNEKVPRHRCPNWCHRCPEMIAIALERDGNDDVTRLDEFDVTMPVCMGGVLYALEGCYCWKPGDEPPPRVDVSLDRRWYDVLVRLAEKRAHPNESSHTATARVARRLLTEAIMCEQGVISRV